MLNISGSSGYAHPVAKRLAPDPLEGDTVVLRDPKAIRALAHPARIEIIRALFEGEELTATECAQLTGLSPSATSYHLKALAKWGILEAAARRDDGRDRPWRARGRFLQVESQVRMADGVAELAILTSFLNQDREAAIAWARQEAQQPPEWRDALQVAFGERWMTPEELSTVAATLGSAARLYYGRTRRSRPAGSRRVRISTLVVPVLEPIEPGG